MTVSKIPFYLPLLLTLSWTTNFKLFQPEKICRTTIWNGRKFSRQVENTVEKEKLLDSSNFSFSHSVFKRLVLQTRKSQGLFGKGLIVNNFSKFELNIFSNKRGITECQSFSHDVNDDARATKLPQHLLWKQLTRSLIHHFKTIPNSKKLQTTSNIWLLQDLKIQIA